MKSLKKSMASFLTQTVLGLSYRRDWRSISEAASKINRASLFKGSETWDSLNRCRVTKAAKSDRLPKLKSPALLWKSKLPDLVPRWETELLLMITTKA